jgi:hypothetical protein
MIQTKDPNLFETILDLSDYTLGQGKRDLNFGFTNFKATTSKQLMLVLGHVNCL